MLGIRSEGGADGFGYALHLLGGEVELGFAEVHVGLGAHGHEVDVGMGYFQTYHTLSDLAAGHSLADGLGYTLRKELHGCKLLVLEIEYVVDLALGNHEYMARSYRIDVKKREEAVIFSYLIRGYFARCYLGEYRCHRVGSEADFYDFKFHYAGRHFDFHHFAELMAEQPLGYRGA